MELDIYHGTCLKNANSIIKGKKFTFHKRVNHWLGNGIYFFINDFSAAKWWAKNQCKQGGAVIYGKLQIEEDDLLDLDTLAGAENLKEVIKSIKMNGLDISLTDAETQYLNKHPDDLQNIMRSKLITWAVELLSIKACSYTFPVNKYKKLSDYGVDTHERQLNVIDQSIINFDKLCLEKL